MDNVRHFDAWTVDCPHCQEEFTLVDDISARLSQQDHIFCVYCGEQIAK